MSTPNKRRSFRRGVSSKTRARVVAQTQFDRQLMRVEELVQQFHDLIEQGQQSPAYREGMCAKLWAIRSREILEAFDSLSWAMKKAQMRAFPMDAENGT